jgi:hypothetical protein
MKGVVVLDAMLDAPTKSRSLKAPNAYNTRIIIRMILTYPQPHAGSYIRLPL